MFIMLVSWIFVGTIVGYIASKNVKLRGDDPKVGIASGIGVIAGGILYRIFSGNAIAGFTSGASFSQPSRRSWLWWRGT